MANSQTSVPRRIALIVTGFLSIALSVLLIDTVIDIWPAVGPQSELCKQAEAMPLEEREPFLERMRKGYKVNCRYNDVPVTRVNLGGTHTYLAPGQGLVGLVVIFAALGALLRSMRSVVWAGAGWGEEDFSVLWSLVRPVAAAVLALILYFVLRAVFLPSGKMATVNPYGFLALAALIGLFCDELLGRVYAGMRSLGGKR